MSGIQTMTLKSGATLGTTGGTDYVFAPDGITIQNGVHLTVPAVANYAERPVATVKYRPPVLGADGGYTKDKKSVSFSIPRTLSNGKVVFDTLRIEREIHPETTAADALDMNVLGAQMLFDSEAATFWSAGSLS
jgi:transcriptional/translational regulatory protein YebC/TACO1